MSEKKPKSRPKPKPPKPRPAEHVPLDGRDRDRVERGKPEGEKDV